MEKIAAAKDVSFGYDNNLVLENINIDIYKGEYLGIVGPNGSAKSTLIKLFLNILKPQKGTIELFGKKMEAFSDWGKIGYVAQKANSFNSSFPATVQEVVLANLFPKVGLFKAFKREHVKKAEEALEIVGMEQYKDRLIGKLSGGQQQKVFIARTLISSPELIFLDEPTVGIDIKSQEEFYRLMKKLNEDLNITIVMVSHDIGAITENVSKVACMGDKKLITHNQCANIPFGEVLSKFYGNKMNLLVHHHEH